MNQFRNIAFKWNVCWRNLNILRKFHQSSISQFDEVKSGKDDSDCQGPNQIAHPVIKDVRHQFVKPSDLVSCDPVEKDLLHSVSSPQDLEIQREKPTDLDLKSPEVLQIFMPETKGTDLAAKHKVMKEITERKLESKELIAADHDNLLGQNGIEGVTNSISTPNKLTKENCTNSSNISENIDQNGSLCSYGEAHEGKTLLPDLLNKSGYPESSQTYSAAHKLFKEINEKSSKLNEIQPVPPEKSFNFAPYVNDSETLTKLVHLGMNLRHAERFQDVANLLVKADFERDIRPVIVFLHGVGVKDEEIGDCLSKHPHIFLEDIDDLDVRVQYLRSKKFSDNAIAGIITVAPGILSKTAKEIDSQLGFMQKLFNLTGDEVRQAVMNTPSVILWKSNTIKFNRVLAQEFMGFNENDLKKILLQNARLYIGDRERLMEAFDYLHNEMGIPHERLVEVPAAITCRNIIIKERHQYLLHLSKNQYDPTKPNYVSLYALIQESDEKFCEEIAKVPLEKYWYFLKTL